MTCKPNAIDLVLIRAIKRSRKTNRELASATGDAITHATVGNVRECNNHATTATVAILAELFDLELRKKRKPRVKR